MTECPELETNEIRRIFFYYDPRSTGFLQKKDIKYLLFEIKTTLENNKTQINEKVFVDKMLNFYHNSSDKISFLDVKVFFYEILNHIKPKTVKFIIFSYEIIISNYTLV